MYWLDNDSGVTTPPAIPAVVSATRQYFTEGGGGVQPSIPGGEWFNMMTDEMLQVLTLAGIAPDKADHTQLAKAIQAIAFSACPVGVPEPWPLATPPAGFLLVNGQTFNPTTYPKLALAYPSGTLPDLRGEFIRGWDNGRGVDSGRALLSAQAGAVESHTHRAITGFNTDANRNMLGTLAADPLAVKLVDGGTTVTFTSARIEATGGTETRSRNIAYNYIVRAA
ncbi:phage tail protein [Aeromonas caviae]|uniref:phage tail protein n=1 Tax=Aeromonas caviae TaxID=648 RepID=UPI002907CA6D|nr:phage tail protein [Aeromonas caviae]MDU7778710.1 phage tail protein [Aeromonas caviae]MDX7814368.1 phage tail protein [Aeromonas caviae]